MNFIYNLNFKKLCLILPKSQFCLTHIYIILAIKRKRINCNIYLTEKKVFKKTSLFHESFTCHIFIMMLIMRKKCAIKSILSLMFMSKVDYRLFLQTLSLVLISFFLFDLYEWQ